MPNIAAPPISVLVLDDHALFRESVTRLLWAEEGFTVRHCGTIEEALALILAHRVDVVLLDLDLGNQNGLDFIPLARQQGYAGKTLVVAAAVNDQEAARLIQQGAAGILTKHESASRLADAIREVQAGRLYLDQQLLSGALHAGGEAPRASAAPFTERERQVLRMVFEGLTNKEIGDGIGVSESAIKATLQQLFGKTGVRTRSQLVRIVLERYQHDI